MKPAILQSQKNGGGKLGNEVPLHGLEIQDIFKMYHHEPIFKIAEKAFLAKVLREPFTFTIKKLGMKNGAETDIIIKDYWMPWLRKQYAWEKMIGITPFMLVPLKGNSEHMVPYIPDPSMGHITVSTTEDKPPKLRYKWYWNHILSGDQEEKKMLWIISDYAPDAAGRIQSPMTSLLGIYRSMIKLRTAQDIASTQAAKPVHVIERNPSMKSAIDDGLARHSANWDKAAGIGKARRERMQQAELRVRQKELHRNLEQMENANRQQSTMQQALWTDTPQQLLEEMDAGFSNRVVTLEDNNKYVTAARPQLVADYNKAEQQFNLMAAATMDFALETLTAVGTARSQNIQGAEQYERDRIREQTTRYETILRPVIILAYRKRLQPILDEANRWMISRLGGDAFKVNMLSLGVDVMIDLSNTTVTTDDEMISYWMNGFVSQKTAAEHILRNKNIPLEKMELSAWPDNYPKERLVKARESKKRETKEEQSETEIETQQVTKKKAKKTQQDQETEIEEGAGEAKKIK